MSSDSDEASPIVVTAANSINYDDNDEDAYDRGTDNVVRPAFLQEFQQNFTFSDLPEHVLIDIFMFLNPYQSFSDQTRIRRLDVWNDHSQTSQRIHQQRVDKNLKKEDVLMKNNLALVSRNWRNAACDDVLWKAQAIYLHKQLCVKIKRPKNGQFVNTLTRKGNMQVNYVYGDRKVNRKCISLDDLTLADIPRNNFKDHYFNLITRREKLYEKLVQTERKDTSISNFIIRLQWLCEIPYHLSLINFLYWVLVAQVLLLIAFWFTNYDSSYYIYFLSPIMLLCITMIFGIPLLVYTLFVLHDHELEVDKWLIALLFAVGLLIWFLTTPIFMIVINLGVLPRYSWRLFHAERIPWPIVFLPWALFFGVCGCLATGAVILNVADRIKKGYGTVHSYFCEDSADGRWSLLGIYALFSVCLFWIFLGFSFEFWNYFFVPLAFIPLFVMEIIAQVPIGFWAYRETKNTYTSSKDKFISYNMMVFPMVLMFAQVICCFAQIIGPFALIGPLIPFTQVCIFAGYLIFEADRRHAICADWEAKKPARYSRAQIFCCEGI